MLNVNVYSFYIKRYDNAARKLYLLYNKALRSDIYIYDYI